MLSLGAERWRAHEGHDHPTPYPVKKQYRPTPIPDRVILTWTDDPATTVNVTWRTSVEVTQSIGQYAEAASLVGDMQFGDVKHAQQIEGSLESFTSDLGEAHVHSLKLTALKPATKYAYRVGDGVNWSEWFHFTTAADQPAPFTFIYFGDAQNDVASLWSRVVREAYSDAPEAAFMLHAGDLINHAKPTTSGANGSAPAVSERDDSQHRHARQSRVRALADWQSAHWPLAAAVRLPAERPARTGGDRLLDRLPRRPDHFAQLQ